MLEDHWFPMLQRQTHAVSHVATTSNAWEADMATDVACVVDFPNGDNDGMVASHCLLS